jgi:hypothetical protein
VVAGDRHSARRDRGIDKARAVGLAACECKEQIAGLDHAAVHGKAGDIDRRGPRVYLGLVAEEVAKLHQSSGLTDADT